MRVNMKIGVRWLRGVNSSGGLWLNLIGFSFGKV